MSPFCLAGITIELGQRSSPLISARLHNVTTLPRLMFHHDTPRHRFDNNCRDTPAKILPPPPSRCLFFLLAECTRRDAPYLCCLKMRTMLFATTLLFHRYYLPIETRSVSPTRRLPHDAIYVHAEYATIPNSQLAV